jgi:hypothetical protein
MVQILHHLSKQIAGLDAQGGGDLFEGGECGELPAGFDIVPCLAGAQPTTLCGFALAQALLFPKGTNLGQIDNSHTSSILATGRLCQWTH